MADSGSRSAVNPPTPIKVEDRIERKLNYLSIRTDSEVEEVVLEVLLLLHGEIKKLKEEVSSARQSRDVKEDSHQNISRREPPNPEWQVP